MAKEMGLDVLGVRLERDGWRLEQSADGAAKVGEDGLARSVVRLKDDAQQRRIGSNDAARL